MKSYRRSRRAPRRRRHRRSRRNTAQQYFRNKMTVLVPIKSNQGQGNVKYCFSLQNTGDNVNVAGFDGAPRWAQTYKNYEAYAVKGMKIKYIPMNVRGGVSQNVTGDLIQGTGQISSTVHHSQLGNQSLYFDIDTYDTTGYTYDQIVVLDKNWQFDPTRTWSKYFSAKNLSRMQNVKWQDTADYAANTRNELTKASIGFIQPYSGQGDGGDTTFGYLKVTWYVTFRGQAFLQ